MTIFIFTSFNINTMNIALNSKKQYNLSNPVFTGYRSAAGRKLDEVIKKGFVLKTDSEFILKELKKIFDKRLKYNQKVGEGCLNTVYKIDDKYVFRIPINNNNFPEEALKLRVCKFEELKHYYGEPVAELGNLYILRNVTSNGKYMPVGIPKDYPSDNLCISGLKYYNEQFLPTFAKLPQKTYNVLAKNLEKLNSLSCPAQNKYYRFDYNNPNNFILTGKTIKITDDIIQTSEKNENSIADLVNVFLRQMRVNIPAFQSKQALPFRKQIAKKIITAGIKHQLPIGDYKQINSGWNYIFKYLCEAKEEPANIFKMLKFIQKCKNNNKRLNLTTEYLDKFL